jgi:hypothetical protein
MSDSDTDGSEHDDAYLVAIDEKVTVGKVNWGKVFRVEEIQHPSRFKAGKTRRKMNTAQMAYYIYSLIGHGAFSFRVKHILFISIYTVLLFFCGIPVLHAFSGSFEVPPPLRQSDRCDSSCPALLPHHMHTPILPSCSFHPSAPYSFFHLVQYTCVLVLVTAQEHGVLEQGLRKTTSPEVRGMAHAFAIEQDELESGFGASITTLMEKLRLAFEMFEKYEKLVAARSGAGTTSRPQPLYELMQDASAKLVCHWLSLVFPSEFSSPLL